MHLPVVALHDEIDVVAGVNLAGGAGAAIEHNPDFAGARPGEDEVDNRSSIGQVTVDDVLVEAPDQPGRIQVIGRGVAKRPVRGLVPQRPDDWLKLAPGNAELVLHSGPHRVAVDDPTAFKFSQAL